MGIGSHSFQARAVLNVLYEVCKGTPSGLESDHSCTVTNKSDVGFWTEPRWRNSGCCSCTENGICFCFPSKAPLCPESAQIRPPYVADRRISAGTVGSGADVHFDGDWEVHLRGYCKCEGFHQCPVSHSVPFMTRDEMVPGECEQLTSGMSSVRGRQS